MNIKRFHRTPLSLHLQLIARLFGVFGVITASCGPSETILSSLASQDSQSEIISELPITSLNSQTTQLDCQTLIEIIEFSERFHIKNQQGSTFDFSQKDFNSSFVNNVSKRFDPLGVYLHQSEHRQIKDSLTAFALTPTLKTCKAFRALASTYTLGVQRYLNITRDINIRRSSKIPKLSIDKLQHPSRTLKALQKRIHNVSQFEQYYLNLASRLSGGAKTISSTDYIHQFTSDQNNYKNYTDELFSTQRVLAVILKSYLMALDPYSNFYSQLEFTQSRFYSHADLNQHVGVGITAREPYGFLTISNIIRHSQAYKLGKLTAGDIILAIYDPRSKRYVSSFSMPYMDMIRLLKGKKNSTLKMIVVSQKPPSTRPSSRVDLFCEEIAVVRKPFSEIHSKKIESHITQIKTEANHSDQAITSQIGYIKPTKFYRTTTPRGQIKQSMTIDMAYALSQMNLNDLDALVLDLRDNPGGHFTEALLAHRLFSTKHRPWTIQGSLNISFLSRLMETINPTQPLYTGPLVIAVNEATASAAENLAQSLQSIGRAIVVGSTHTMGKGLMQSLIVLNPSKPNLGAILLSTHSLKPAAFSINRNLKSDVILSIFNQEKPRVPLFSSAYAHSGLSEISKKLQRFSNQRLQNTQIPQPAPYRSLFTSRINRVCENTLVASREENPQDPILKETFHVASDYAYMLIHKDRPDQL